MILLQGAPVELIPLGVGGAIAVFVIMVWRQDRRGWISRYEEDRKRLELLTGDFRIIVQDNTKALTQLTDALNDASLRRCPAAVEELFPRHHEYKQTTGDE